jgi:hypothetical protein
VQKLKFFCRPPSAVRHLATTGYPLSADLFLGEMARGTYFAALAPSDGPA